ncbi:MAG: hypothetical protein ACI4DU_10355 [Lachnospiraceae bacterium]
MVNYLGVRKCKKLIKEFFYSDIRFYSHSYNAFKGFERISGYFSDSDLTYTFSFQNRSNGGLWIHIVVSGLDYESISDNVYILDPTHSHFIYKSERCMKEF